jgi:hypothetical protein
MPDMKQRLERIRATILQRLPESRLEPLSAVEINAFKSRLPDIPSHLASFFEVIGCGTIGRSRYKLYGLISPRGIFDDQTASTLPGVVLIGDDFAGRHEAYDSLANWRFGSVGGNGRFQPHTQYETVIDFIEDWYAKEA